MTYCYRSPRGRLIQICRHNNCGDHAVGAGAIVNALVGYICTCLPQRTRAEIAFITRADPRTMSHSSVPSPRSSPDMSDRSAFVAVLFVSLSIFVFFKYCLGHPRDDGGLQQLSRHASRNATWDALRHVVFYSDGSAASVQLQFV